MPRVALSCVRPRECGWTRGWGGGARGVGAKTSSSSPSSSTTRSAIVASTGVERCCLPHEKNFRPVVVAESGGGSLAARSRGALPLFDGEKKRNLPFVRVGLPDFDDG